MMNVKRDTCKFNSGIQVAHMDKSDQWVYQNLVYFNPQDRRIVLQARTSTPFFDSRQYG